MSALRVVLDTNVLVSGIAYPTSIPGKIITSWRHGALDLCLSAYILDELRRVLPRLSHRHNLSADEIDELVDILSLQVELLEPIPLPMEFNEGELRDAADAPILGTLFAALQTNAANYLITGDGDLLALAETYPIVSPAEFWAMHGGL